MSSDARLSVVSGFAHDLARLGPANFLYPDGDALFAHGHRRMHYTQVLALNDIPVWQYYACAALYILVFMLDGLFV